MAIRSRQAAEAHEAMAGRPRKYKGEETAVLSVRLPLSLMQYLSDDPTVRREKAFEYLLFERSLAKALEPLLQELRISAARANQGYESDRVDTIARLVKLGLAAEKSPKK